MKSLKSLIKRFKPLLIAILVFVLAVAVATPTIAYYIITGGKVQGDYQPGEPSPPIIKEESPNPVIRIFALDADNTTMKDVYISVPDYGYPVFVRVALLVTWLKPADCTCIQPVCGLHYCKGCEICGDDCDGLDCEDCEGCEDCIIIPECENCPDCENCEDHEKGDCEGCLLCNKVTCDDCENCPSENCTECSTNCTDCEGCKNLSECGVCVDCSKCIEKEDCPACNDDPDDDYDIFFQIPELGEEKDYTMALGKADENSSAGSWVANAQNSATNEVFYYYSIPVQSRGTATNGSKPTQIATPLLTEFVFLSETAKPPMEGCILNVEIIVQTIQAIGYTDENDDPAWKDAWKDHVYDKWETVTY